ncbi:hypothetical protein OBBRIDRAFT_802932 [Obba rivulosa]|uniref:Uncharacterized protein n=1 Tax=Obba rivulosa TaxID=1052685 RepID=A0A8E2AZK1_9APHY|nr:hypothetical protein OBBRIDRAFT_802932 [Obba rivulosa]
MCLRNGLTLHPNPLMRVSVSGPALPPGNTFELSLHVKEDDMGPAVHYAGELASSATMDAIQYCLNSVDGCTRKIGGEGDDQISILFGEQRPNIAAAQALEGRALAMSRNRRPQFPGYLTLQPQTVTRRQHFHETQVEDNVEISVADQRTLGGSADLLLQEKPPIGFG